MSRHLTKTLLLLVCAGFAACERGPSPNDEVASELRALRLALRDSRPQAAGEAPAAAREAIDGAMRPLRDVLTQLGNSQRELATRQTALTQELARWTQLVVGAMQEKQAEQGRDLQLRLEQLEQSMAQQDARHREVETLMQGALDSTATHLEDFLRRLEQLTPRDPPDPTAADNPVDKGAGGESPPPPEREAASGGSTPGGTAGAPPTKREGSSRWPWWVMATAAVVMGVRLLMPRRRAPLAVATEMQAAAPPVEGDAALAARARQPAETALDEPEVEELWAAAALLGEAIGKIKQSAHPEEVERLLVGPLGDIGAAGAIAPPPAPGPESAVAASMREAELDLDDLFVIDEHEDEVEPAPESPAESATEPVYQLPRAPAGERRAEPPPRPESITCRLAVRDAPRAEAAVRQLLDTDPRVLVQPAPQVRPAAGELCVVFALLPGLPPGERSQLEQRLRDAVA